MSRKRTPVAEIGAEDYYIVRHTHDIELAAKLMRAQMLKDIGCLRRSGPSDWHTCGDECLAEYDPGKPTLEWVRIVPALPNTYAASEGWEFTYATAKPHTRGAFPAVVFS